MFAVIKTGGKQYKVQQGDVLQVEKLGLDKEKTITFEEVLLVEDGKKTLIGTPFVENAKVHAVVVDNFKDDKVILFKKKRRKQYRRTKGHRQELSQIRIEDITIGGAAPKKTKPAAPKKEEKPVEKKPAAKKSTAKKTVVKKATKKAPTKKTVKKTTKKTTTKKTTTKKATSKKTVKTKKK